MICARCGADSRKKERVGGRCPTCGGQFAFRQSREDDPISDQTFARAIEVVSGRGQIRWGVEHLYYEVARRARHARSTTPGTFLAGLVIVLTCSAYVATTIGFKPWMLIPAVLLWLLFGRLLARFWPRRDMRQEEFEQIWKRWCAVHGMPKGAIVRRQPIGQVVARAAEPDLNLYSFDRAVICDRARTVDLLLANNFHFENNCAVLSVDGYPRAAFDTVLAMLRRNPRLRIFALHDCTRDGCMLARKLASDPSWFLGQSVVDVGLRPVHARKLPNLIPVKTAPALALGISRDEFEWLSKYTAELAVLRPEQVIRRLFHAMNKAGEDDTELDYDHEKRRERNVTSDDESLTVDLGADDGGADSFG